MSRRSPFEVCLCSEDRAVLEERASSRKSPHAVVVRARIVLLAAEGARNTDIATRVGVFRDPAGNFAEYYADLDQIPEDAEWDARDWAPDKSLYAWGPPVPKAFVNPDDVEEIAAALQGVS